MKGRVLVLDVLASVLPNIIISHRHTGSMNIVGWPATVANVASCATLRESHRPLYGSKTNRREHRKEANDVVGAATDLLPLRIAGCRNHDDDASGSIGSMERSYN